MTCKIRNAIQAVLEAIAVGDAMGMPTEGMTQKDIRRVYPKINGLVPMTHSLYRKAETVGTITDDMGQNLYLIKSYLSDQRITIENSVSAIHKWVVECNGDRFMGPSTRSALEAIQNGESVYTAGKNGTSCGAMMRVPAIVLCTSLRDAVALMHSINSGCIPTHNTSQALEAAAGYGYALRQALIGGDMNEIVDAAIYYADKSVEGMDHIACAPSSARRLEKLRAEMDTYRDEESLMKALYYVYGSNLDSIEVFTAVFAIFIFSGKDVFRAIRIATRLGGDTDSIAALAGALCAAYAGDNNIPRDIVDKINQVNSLDLSSLADEIVSTFQQ